MSFFNQISTLFFASDHAAFEAKSKLIKDVKKLYPQLTVIDLGPGNDNRVDYPVYGKKLALEVLKNTRAAGVALCGTGIGISMQVNRFQGIRGALCVSQRQARLTREHNNSNVLCLPGREPSIDSLESILRTWLQTDFEGGRHLARINQLDS